MIQFSIGKSGIEGAERRIFSVILCFADMITKVNLILCCMGKLTATFAGYIQSYRYIFMDGD